ncbi:MAG: hypothetical protein ACTSVZ_02060 [Promethearchaeota archaeon]
MNLFEIKNENIKQLRQSFIVSVLWTTWIGIWFFFDFFIRFVNGPPFVYSGNQVWVLHYFLSVFALYSILYLPRYAHSTKRSLLYLLKICLLQLGNVIVLVAIFIAIHPTDHISSPMHALFPVFILGLNFILIWMAKYSQLTLWKKFKSTITLSTSQEETVRTNLRNLLIFVIVGVILLNVSGFYFANDIVYLLFTATQIVLSVGYWLHVSENRKWLDRFIDFIVLLVLNVINLLIKFLQLEYLAANSGDTFIVIVLMFELFQVYIFYSFFSRTYLADFTLNLHKKPEQFKRTSSKLNKSIEKTEIRCPKCDYKIEQVDESMIKDKIMIFCPGCGEKIMLYELFEPSEAEVIAKHQKILQKLDEKDELSTHLS